MIPKAFSSAALIMLGSVVLTGCSPHGDLTVGKPQINPDGSESEWRPVSSKRGRFKALMPGIPEETINIVKTSFGELSQCSVTVEPAGTIAYAVSYFAQPKQADTLASSVRLERVRKSVIGDDGNLISERQLKANGQDATELVVEKLNGQARITVRIYFVRTRIYTAAVVMPNKFFASPKNPNTPNAASNLMLRFFDSIEFQ